ncbi:hypothetical protein U5M32_06125 [Streptococcus sp. TATVAM-FAB35]
MPQCEGNVTHWGRGQLNAGARFYFDGGSDGEIELKGTVVVDEYILKNDYWNWRLRVDYVTSGKIQWKEAKAEISETATPYSQAPEDLGWSSTAPVPTQANRYLWKFEYIYYSDDSVEVTQPVNLSIAGADADTVGVTAAISEIDSKANSLRADLTNVSNSLSNAASQLQAQAAAQADLTSRVSTVEETANGTKTTVTELAKTVDDNTDDITSITQRTTAIETDLSGTKATLSQVQTTANTTKTNLASYQASNDQAVANLQSSLQTTNGNVSSLQTQVAAVPGQITSAVSAVEGKIPKSAGGRNLALGTSAEYNTGKTSFSGINNETVVIYKIYNKGLKVGDKINARIVIKYSDIVAVEGQTARILPQTEGNVTHWGPGGLNVGGAIFPSGEGDEVVLTATSIITESQLQNEYWSWRLRIDYVSSGCIQWKEAKAEVGDLPTPWSPAPEDTASQISTLSSQIQQTADGMTLLATKTELNTAKSDLQAGISTAASKADNAQSTANTNAQTISTHTTQISALNTGLQAKVSQSDFNTLSGRVSSAESNLTATANQLSSQITSVDNKIPDSIVGSNLYIISKASKGFISVHSEELGTQTGNNEYTSDFIPVSANDKYVFQGWVTVPENGYPWHRYQFYGADKHKIGGAYMFESNTPLVGEQHYTEHITVPNNEDIAYIRISARLYSDGKLKFEKGNIASDYSLAPEDVATAQALTQAKSEIKQTTDAITASVSSVETKANNAQSTANTAVSKADAAQAGVNTLDSTTVKSASLNLDNNGFVTKVGKTINGNKFATMIAQDANSVKIIADEMNVTADMIVDGAVTANKLNVNNLSAVNSNLGAIKGGSLLLQENKTASSSVDNWGTFNRPAHKQGLYMDNHGLASSGAIQRKNGSETAPTDMPLAVLQSGELRFLVVDYNDNLENVLHYGLSDPDFGAIRFEIDSELKRRLTMTSSGYLNFQASNYTNWIPLSQQGCEYMIQGRLVAVNYDVTYSQGGTHKIGDIPQEFVKKELMLTAKAWSITPNDKNFQLNADGGLHLLNADANVTYRGTLLFSY